MNKCRRNQGNRKSPLEHHGNIMAANKIQKWMLKLVDKNLRTKSIFALFQSIFYKTNIDCKGKHSNFTLEKYARRCLNQMIKFKVSTI